MSKRSERGGAFRKTVLLLAVAAGTAVACKSTDAAEKTTATAAEQCVASLMPPQESLTYTVTCDGFSPEQQRVTSGAHVTFKSECENTVEISFSDRSLFGVPSVTLGHRASATVTAGTVGGCFMLCFDSPQCPPPHGRESKTGNLDVYTSGNEPDPKKAPAQ